jgi:hypothetical protein
LNFDFPDEHVLVVKEPNWWKMYFDRVINVYGNGAGAMIMFPNIKQ